MGDSRDRRGASKAVWAYPTGPKSEHMIRWRVIVLWIAVFYLCAVCLLCVKFFAVLRAGSILRGGWLVVPTSGAHSCDARHDILEVTGEFWVRVWSCLWAAVIHEMTRWRWRRYGLEVSLVNRGLHVMLLMTRMCFYECVLIWVVMVCICWMCVD